jgi:hypothetical protein
MWATTGSHVGQNSSLYTKGTPPVHPSFLVTRFVPRTCPRNGCCAFFLSVFLSVQFPALERSIGFREPGASFQLGSTLQARALPYLGFEFPRVSFPRRGLAQRGPLRHMVTSIPSPIPSPPFSRRLSFRPFPAALLAAPVSHRASRTWLRPRRTRSRLCPAALSLHLFPFPIFVALSDARFCHARARGAFPAASARPQSPSLIPDASSRHPRQRLVAASRRVRQSTQKGCGSLELS